jgi:uncharacterized membrane protein
MMVLYHLMYDLDAFGGYPIEATTGFWALFADVTAAAFLLLVGVSLAISYAKATSREPGRRLFGKYLLRGLKVLGYGMVLTLLTWTSGIGIIVFGILHLIGVSIVLAYPFLKFRLLNLVLGIAVFALGVWVSAADLVSRSPWLLPFGVVPEGLDMPDYRPILPWFGVVLVGIAVGNFVYGSGRRPAFVWPEAPAVASPLVPLGRNSLLIYLFHQPVMVALLWAMGVIEPGGV